jgi:hypothetical protein
MRRVVSRVAAIEPSHRTFRWTGVTGGVLAAMLFGSPDLGAQTLGTSRPLTLTGTVLDTAQLPVSEANVELLGLGRAQSDAAGLFRFSAVPGGGPILLHVTRIGFQPLLKVIRLPDADSVDIDVTLRPSITRLAPVVVREDSTITPLSDPTGFDRRRRNSGGGHFITDADIERSRSSSTSQILRTVPGVSVNTRGEVVVERGAMTLKGPPCNTAIVFVDGVAIPTEKKAFTSEFDDDTGFSVDQVPIQFIRGIEVYAGPAATPVELRSSRTVCGTVAIWTKAMAQSRRDSIAPSYGRPPKIPD